MADLTVLGFDYGERRIGIAVGQTITNTARPVTTVVNPKGKTNWIEIDKVIQEWRPDKLLVGLPLHMDGSEQLITEKCKAFADALTKRTSLETAMVDERLSSAAATDVYIAQRQSGLQKRKNKAQIDSMAASVIVERWLSGDFDSTIDTFFH